MTNELEWEQQFKINKLMFDFFTWVLKSTDI